MAKQVRKALDGGRRKRQRQAQDVEPAAVEPQITEQEETEAETQEAEAQVQQPEREQALGEEQEEEQQQEQPSQEVEDGDEPVEQQQQQQAQETPMPVPTAPALPVRAALRHVSKQLARPSNQVFTLTPLDRLLPVQPVEVREFADWQSLRTYVSSYAQQTNQVRVLRMAFIRSSWR